MGGGKKKKRGFFKKVLFFGKKFPLKISGGVIVKKRKFKKF
ncbi:hypothetical protein ThesiDRAFT1_0999 [Thermoanaerobacter siderophilus SR4]|uniref:Uncharacterized protein n=1 Tax=Thermoanaerobacter siderophilus SR4 TaxID=880478 RepID=I8QY77_9THEO|nr:hypothetical protein ThesiDRAFT1_0999 [Thermoanaerobacter siderophilus SR4]